MSNQTLRECFVELADVIRSKLSITDSLSIKKMSELISGLASHDGVFYNKYNQLMNKTITRVEYDDLNGITGIANYVFNLCKQLDTVVLPNTITSIGKGVFYGCQSLRNIYVSDENGNLVSDENGNPVNTFPDGVSSIRGAVLRRCYALTSFVIPDSVTSISGNAFNECRSLTRLTIPSSVKSIGEYALRIGSSTNKATIIMESRTPPTISDNSIFNPDTLLKIVVPYGCANTYKARTNWVVFADKITEVM